MAQGHIVLKPSSNVSLTVSSASVGLPEPPTNATGGILMIETADVRTRWDGQAPVAGSSGGLRMASNSVWEINGRDFFTAIRFIRESVTDAVVNVAYTAGG